MSPQAKIDDQRRQQENGPQLTTDIGIDSHDITRWKDFTNFETGDRRHLKEEL